MSEVHPAQGPPASRFAGFVRPEQNWFKLPHDWTDITAAMTSLAELKVVEYVLKHTWGYREYGVTKEITTDEFMHGRQRKDGSRMDKGTGLSKPSVIDGLRKAVKQGYLTESVDTSDRARIKKAYALRMQASEEAGHPQLPSESPPESSQIDVKYLDSSVKHLDAEVKMLHSRGKASSQRTEKDTLDRYFKPFNGGDSIFKRLPDFDQPPEKTQYVADFILERLGDQQSVRFYQLIAAKIPEHVIRAALSEIKADGAEAPPKLFTHKMKQYALQQLKKRIGSL